MRDDDDTEDFSDCDEYHPLSPGKSRPHPDEGESPEDDEWLLIAIAKEEERQWLEGFAEQEFAKANQLGLVF